jgi:hypothetical protein
MKDARDLEAITDEELKKFSKACMKESLWSAIKRKINKAILWFVAYRAEGKGDFFSKKSLPRNACDFYILSLFLYDVVGSERSAYIVKYKMENNNAVTYNPLDRESWPQIREILYGENLRNIGLYYEPKFVAQKYFSNMPVISDAFKERD